jgi:pentose-5-phosphate-3-epimerase
MVALGADVIVAGSSSLFHKDYSLKEAAAKLRKDMA